MPRKTRLFLLVAAGVLVLGLGTGLVASYMGLPAIALMGSDGPEELEYVPADARLIAFANVRDVMNSELRQKIRDARPETGTRDDDFEAKTGIDIENDIDRVVAVLSGDEGEHHERALVIARGRFDQVRMEGLAREHGGTAEEYQGTRLISHRKGDMGMALAFIEPGVVAFGTDAGVRRAIDTKRGAGANVTANAEVMALVRDIEEGNAWAVGRFDAIANRARLPQEVANQLPPINWFAASGHVNGGLRGMVRAEARDEAAAQNLRDVVRGFMALAKLHAGAKPEFTAMLETLELGGDGKTVSLAFSLPSEVIDMLASMHHGRRQGEREHHDHEEAMEHGDAPVPPVPPLPPAPPEPPF